jgi:hypothetical protein
MPMPMHCAQKQGVCGNPTNCRGCRHVQSDAEWVCSRCLQPEDQSTTYYDEGFCTRCGRHAAATVALDLSAPGPGSGR